MQEKIATAVAEEQDFGCLYLLYLFLRLATFRGFNPPPRVYTHGALRVAYDYINAHQGPCPSHRPIHMFNHGYVHLVSATLPQGVRTEGVAT